MKWVIWWGILAVIFSLFFWNIDEANKVLSDVDKQVSYVWAKYVAEASIEKELLAIKSEDVDKVMKFNDISWQWLKKDDEYWFINENADTWYFDLELNSTTTDEIELGSIVWGDILFEWLNNEDFFDTFILNFNKNTSSDVLVEIIKSEKNNWNYEPCDFYENVEWNCSYVSKTVINGSDSNLNWRVIDWLQIYYKSWNDWYDNQIEIQWFNVNSYNYRISFSTLMWESIPFWYYVENWGWRKQVANNFIEIDTTGNAIDSFSRMRLEKRISNDIQPNSKYVIFSSSELAK